MPFTIDEETLLIRGRKGDTASFTFNFNQDMSSYAVHFYIKKNSNAPDAIIDKEYKNLTGTHVTVELTTEDTEKLTALTNSYNTYCWGLKITNGTNFAQTLIPREFNTPPLMYIYPEIGGS